MKKILPILVILIAVGVGFYFLKTKDSSESVLTDLTEKKSELFSGSLKAAIELGIPMKCEYQVAEGKAEGYIKGQQWRGKMEFADGRKAEIIIKDNCMWSWVDTEDQGMKMCFDEAEQDIWDESQEGSASDVEYFCVPAVVTDAKFIPPADIQFMTLDEMMGGYGQEMPEY